MEFGNFVSLFLCFLFLFNCPFLQQSTEQHSTSLGLLIGLQGLNWILIRFVISFYVTFFFPCVIVLSKSESLKMLYERHLYRYLFAFFINGVCNCWYLDVFLFLFPAPECFLQMKNPNSTRPTQYPSLFIFLWFTFKQLMIVFGRLISTLCFFT